MANIFAIIIIILIIVIGFTFIGLIVFYYLNRKLFVKWFNKTFGLCEEPTNKPPTTTDTKPQSPPHRPSVWLNIIGMVLSVVLLIVTWARYFFGDTKTKKLLVTLSMIFSIIGQFLSWLGTDRSFVICIAISINILALEVITSTVVVFIYLKLSEN